MYECGTCQVFLGVTKFWTSLHKVDDISESTIDEMLKRVRCWTGAIDNFFFKNL